LLTRRGFLGTAAAGLTCTVLPIPKLPVGKFSGPTLQPYGVMSIEHLNTVPVTLSGLKRAEDYIVTYYEFT